MAQSDNSTLILLAAVAGGGFFAYKQGWFSSLTSFTSTSSNPGIDAAAAAAAAKAIADKAAADAAATAAANTAAAAAKAAADKAAADKAAADAAAAAAASKMPPSLFSLVQLIASQTKGGEGPDQYDYYMTNTYPGLGPLPAPETLFSGWSRPQPMAFPTYWAQMSPWLHTNKGLSGSYWMR